MISLLDSITLSVQAIDFVLMLIVGLYCWRSTRRRRHPGLTLLTVSCFVSAVILLGYFLSGLRHGPPALGQTAYLVARLLAPFELLLFAVSLIMVAWRNVDRP
jgi:hypothetical protein